MGSLLFVLRRLVGLKLGPFSLKLGEDYLDDVALIEDLQEGAWQLSGRWPCEWLGFFSQRNLFGFSNGSWVILFVCLTKLGLLGSF